MKNPSLILFAAVCAALVPGLALAGNGGTGACYVVSGDPVWPAGNTTEPEGGIFIAGCADGLTEQACTAVDELVFFAEGATCADVALKGGFDWQGSCEASIDPVGTACIQLYNAEGSLGAEAICVNEIGGRWFTDLECGGAPVPAMPSAGMAVLALLMLAGALIVLTMRGRRISA